MALALSLWGDTFSVPDLSGVPHHMRVGIHKLFHLFTCDSASFVICYASQICRLACVCMWCVSVKVCAFERHTSSQIRCERRALSQMTTDAHICTLHISHRNVFFFYPRLGTRPYVPLKYSSTHWRHVKTKSTFYCEGFTAAPVRSRQSNLRNR